MNTYLYLYLKNTLETHHKSIHVDIKSGNSKLLTNLRKQLAR